MKRCATITTLVLCLVACTVLAGARGKIVFNEKVVIPFSNLRGWPPPTTMQFPVSPGTYYITLQVDRAHWDAIGIADAVPIGIGAYGLDKKGRKYNNQPWRTGLGFVTTKLYISDDSRLRVVFSTLAPAGARGVLKITRLY